MDEVRAKAQAFTEGNNYVSAENEYEQLMRCNDPNALGLAYMAACHAHKFDDARSLFKRIAPGDKERFRQICQRENFDPSQQ